MPERISEYMLDRVPERTSEDMPDRMPERMSERMSEDMPDRMSEDMPDRMSEDMPDIIWIFLSRAVDYVAIYAMVEIIRSEVFFSCFFSCCSKGCGAVQLPNPQCVMYTLIWIHFFRRSTQLLPLSHSTPLRSDHLATFLHATLHISLLIFSAHGFLCLLRSHIFCLGLLFTNPQGLKFGPFPMVFCS